LKNVLEELNRRETEYKEIRRRREEKRALMRDNFEKIDSIIKLNLRGTIIEVSKDIIANVEGSNLYEIVSSSAFKLDENGEFFIDRCGLGFDRVLEYMSNNILVTKGLNRYDEDCVYNNLEYFKIPHKSRMDYSKVSELDLPFDKLDHYLHLQLQDGRICCAVGTDELPYTICLYNMTTEDIETTLEGHSNIIQSFVQLADGRLCSCSHDSTIKIWLLDSGVCQLSIEDTGYVVDGIIQLQDGRLCCGSSVGTGSGKIEIRNIETLASDLTIFTAETGYIYAVAQLQDGRICSGHTSGSIKLWNSATGAMERVLNGHTDSVNGIVVIDELKIWSCSADNTIKIWNLSTGICEISLGGSKSSGGFQIDAVTDMILLLDGRMFSVSGNGHTKIWSTDTEVCDLTIQVCDMFLLRVFQLQDGRIIVSDFENQVYILG
jgi:BTB/POZ domain/WD domain, G-beta repeat